MALPREAELKTRSPTSAAAKLVSEPSSLSLADLIRETRKRRGITIAELGAAVGYDPSYFSFVERGRRRLEDEAVVRVAEYLGIDTTTALLTALRDRLPAEHQKHVPARLASVDPRGAQALVRQYQAEDFEFEIGRSCVTATSDWDGNLWV